MFYCILIVLGFFLRGCSDLREPVPTTPSATIEVHSSGWLNLGSSDFHGEFIKSLGWDLKGVRNAMALSTKAVSPIVHA